MIEYNANNNSLSDVGYMYGSRYDGATLLASSLNVPYVYGNDVQYYNGTYYLTDVMTSTGVWSTDYNSLNNNHYTCFNTTGTCASVNYIYYTTSGTAYYITLTGGKSVKDALNEMIISPSNTTSSTIKSYIDGWYTTNLASEEGKLEDTVWCNDRSIFRLNGWDPNGGDATKYLYFNCAKRQMVDYYPKLACTRIADSYTKNSNNGNGSLSNPIGLLTVDESMLAGSKSNYNFTTYYLYTGQNYWIGTAYTFYNRAYNTIIHSAGRLTSYNVAAGTGVRPAVSLKPGGIRSGNGTADSPYQVSYS